MNTALPSAQITPSLQSPSLHQSRDLVGRNKLVELAPVKEIPPRSIDKGRRRRVGLVTGFVLCVVLPVAGTIWYMYEHAQDQFASTAAFAIRSEQPTGGLDFLSGLAAMTSSSSTDVEILNLFLTSQDLVAKVEAKFNLRAAWSNGYEHDPVFAFDPDGTIEDLASYWERMVLVDYDANGGLIELEVRSFEPEVAHQIAEIILSESSYLMNHLSEEAQQGMIKSAEQDFELAKSRLTQVRRSVANLRATTGMVDPHVGLSGESGVLQKLQEELAEELVRLDLLRSNKSKSKSSPRNSADTRVSQSELKISVLKDRISQERQKYRLNDGDGYAEMIARFEELLVEQGFAEEAYVAATAALDLARAEARRNSRYLAVVVQPSVAERALYPQRVKLIFFIGAFAFLIWSLITLVVYSVRDRRPV